MKPRFSTYPYGDQFTLECPCGSDCVHIGGVVVDQGGALTIVRGKTVDIGHRDNTGVGSTRGSFIEIECWCESDCRFRLRIAFHKGQISLSIRDHRPGGWDEPRMELWRD